MGYIGDVPLILGPDTFQYREERAARWLKDNNLYMDHCENQPKGEESEEEEVEDQNLGRSH